jgi:hypothetical protein
MRKITRFLSVIILLSGLTLSAHAQNTADPRAVAECTDRGGSFVQINECLPEAHVAYAIFDSVPRVYGDAAKPLLDRCRELNEEIEAAAACVSSAIDQAVQLQTKLPEGTSIPDPLFSVLADPAKAEAVEAAENEAQKAFPDQMFWGGTMYQPYSN